jgi:hypothetical protein
MARAGVAVHTIVDVPGRSGAEVSGVVAATISADPAYEMAPVGPDTYQLVRTYRPTWALAAAIAGAVVFGLGILFLLVRRTESCTLVVTDGATGATIALTGALLPGRVESLREALERGPAPSAAPEPQPSGPTPVPASPEAVSPPLILTGGAVGVAEETVMARPRVEAPTTRSSPLAVRLHDGRLVSLQGRVLVGRDPAPGSGDSTQSVQLVAVADPQMRVSKTHLAIGVRGGEVWVEDLHSTNGTTVEQPGGTSLAVAPGAPVSLRPGSVVHFGGLRAEVVVGG